jgi:hypothetical protein
VLIYSPRSDDPWIDEKKKDKEIKKKETHVSKLIEFATSNSALVPVVIVVFTILYYIYIYNYYSAFFARLSIPLVSLNLPFTFYLSAGIKLLPWIVATVLFIIAFIFILYLYIVIKFYKIMTNDPSNFGKFLFEIAPKIKTADFILSYIVAPIFLFSLLFSLLFIFPYYQGNWDARNLIDGESDNPKMVITLKDNGINLTNNALILVLYNDKNYYLIEKNISAPLHPRPYIIPDSEIKMVTFSANAIEMDPQYENAGDNKSLLSNDSVALKKPSCLRQGQEAMVQGLIPATSCV